MAALHGDRIPYGFWILPVLGLLGWAGIGKGGGLVSGLLLAALLIGSVLAAVHHAELVALRLGEPYGTLVLTLAVTIIELAMIVSLMLTGKPSPFLVRDAVQAVVILVVHGIAGACIVVGALRHREQEFQTSGASAFLAVLMPMVALVLILPNHTLTPHQDPIIPIASWPSSPSLAQHSISFFCSCRRCGIVNTFSLQSPTEPRDTHRRLRPASPGLRRSCWSCP